MSGSTTPVSSASYSDADMRAQSVWQADVNRLKVAQLDELLRRKGIKPKGVKAENSMVWRLHGTTPRRKSPSGARSRRSSRRQRC